MTDRNDNLSPEHAAARRIADTRAKRPAVDHNGRPTGPPVTYRYDSKGVLISVEPDDAA